MALNLEDKKAIVAEVSQAATGALSAVIADYRGLTVSQMTELRKQARAQGVYLKVVRNTLARIAVRGTEFSACTTRWLVRPFWRCPLKIQVQLRLFKEYAKTNDKLEVKALAVGGIAYGAADIDRLASLPTREQALGMLAGVLQAPVTKLARTLNEMPSQIARALAAVKDQKAA